MARGQRSSLSSISNLDSREESLFRTLGRSETALRLAKAYIRCKNGELQALGSKFDADDYLQLYNNWQRPFLFIALEPIELSVISTVCEITMVELLNKYEDFGARLFTFANIFCYFAPCDIPLGMLSTLAGNKQDLERIVQTLNDYSIVEWNKDAGVVNIDDLIRQSKSRNLNSEDSTMRYALIAVQDTDSTTIRHALEVWNLAARRVRWPKEFRRASSHIVLLYLDIGDYNTALRFGWRALEVVKRALASDHPGLLKLEELVSTIPFAKKAAENKLSRIEESKLSAQQQPERAAEFLTRQHKLAVEMTSNAKEALKVLKEVHEERLGSLDSSHRETLLTKGHIARLEYRLDRSKCDECFKVLADVVDVLGDGTVTDCKEIADIRCCLTKMLARRGELDEALTRLRAYHDVYKKLLGSGHDVTVKFLKELGAVLLKKHDYKEALGVFTELLKLQQATLGHNHFRARRTSSRVGDIKATHDNSTGCQFMRELFLSETFHEAAKLLKDVLPDEAKDLLNLIHRAKLPESSSVYLMTIALQSKAEALSDLSLYLSSDIDRAQRSRYNDCMKRIMSRLSKDGVDKFRIHYATALSLLESDEYEESCKAFASLLMTERRSSAFDYVIKLKAQYDRAKAERNSKNLGESLRLFEKVFEKQKELLGADDVVTLATHHEMADALHELNRYNEAAEHFRYVHSRREHLLGPKHLKTVDVHFDLARSLTMQKSYKEALDIFRSVFDERDEKFRPNYPDTLMAQYYMAHCLSRLGKLSQSVELFKEVYSAQRRVLGAEHPDTLKTKEEFYQSHGQMRRDPELSGNEVAQHEWVGSKMRDLHRNINDDNVDAVENLLGEFVDITQVVTDQGWTPLHTIALKGNVRMAQVLVSHADQHLTSKEFQDFVNAPTTSGQNTALHLAAEGGHLKMMQFLLQKKAIYELKNQQDRKPVDLAATTKTGKLLRLIDELFEGTMRGTSGVINIIDGLSVDNIWAVYNTRNVKNQSLTDVAVSNKHTGLARKLEKSFDKKVGR